MGPSVDGQRHCAFQRPIACALIASDCESEKTQKSESLNVCGFASAKSVSKHTQFVLLVCGSVDSRLLFLPLTLQPIFEHYLEAAVKKHLGHGQDVRLVPYKVNIYGQ